MTNYNNILDEQIEQAKAQKQGIKKWIGHSFESSSQTTPEFMAFYNDITKYIRAMVKADYQLFIGKGHFYFSGFLQNRTTRKWCYFSSNDVRYSRDGWYNNLLMRTATGNKDYSGGRNDNATLPNIKSKADNLTI